MTSAGWLFRAFEEAAYSQSTLLRALPGSDHSVGT
jgi:hypothetical protein